MASQLEFLADLADAARAAPPMEARVDLRTGAVAAAAVAPRSVADVSRTLRTARRAWRAAGHEAPLSVLMPVDAMERLDAEQLDDLAREAGQQPRRTIFELDERTLVRLGPDLAEGLRARGWGVALVADPDCPLPFGARARALYGELIIDVPERLDPFVALADNDREPFGRRICAARAAGMTLTARLATDAQARILAAAGFARAGGACARYAM
ncbi:MAG: hypothetical protein GC189_05580 [Alphaproteobacteria bacterium]|nr:hypothetical protein [Alphaproteobacteria bacterium]